MTSAAVHSIRDIHDRCGGRPVGSVGWVLGVVGCAGWVAGSLECWAASGFECDWDDERFLAALNPDCFDDDLGCAGEWDGE